VIEALYDNSMKRFITTFQLITASCGLIFGLFVSYAAYRNGLEGRPDLVTGRYLISAVLIFYSTLQIVAAAKGFVTKTNALAFPFIYLVFGVYAEFFHRGFIKNWAPLTSSEALESNIFGLGSLALIAGMALLIFRSSVVAQNSMQTQNQE